MVSAGFDHVWALDSGRGLGDATGEAFWFQEAVLDADGTSRSKAGACGLFGDAAMVWICGTEGGARRLVSGDSGLTELS